MTIRRYPLSAANGRAIPVEVLGPVSFNKQAYTTSPLGTLVRDQNYKNHILAIRATTGVVFTFSEDDTIGVEDTEVIFLNPHSGDGWHFIAPPKEYYDVVANSAAGDAYINTLVRWDTLSTEVQTDFG